VEGYVLRWFDLIVVAISFAGCLAVGPIFAKRNKTTGAFFLAEGRLPGWLVGFSMMAATVSSMTFLATPGFTYQADWRYMPTHFTLLIAITLAIFIFMPFSRRGLLNSAYQYLENRFGLWARIYAGAGYVLFQIFKAGIVTYAVSLPFEVMTGLPVPWFVLIMSGIVAFYSVTGGLTAIIWLDFIQGVLLMLGGALCLPTIIAALPGGFSELFSVAHADGKLAVGSMSGSIHERTFWVMMLNHVFWYTHMMCADQQSVQRYMSTPTEGEAKKSILLSAALTIPVWVYFTFLGTALYVFYKVNPNEAVTRLASEQILPFYILTRLPVGIAGLVVAAIGAAAMSTLSSMSNSTAQTLTNDFYRRLLVKGKDERHYLLVGRWFTFIYTLLAVVIALVIHWTRTDALINIQQILITLLSGGMLGLFMLGFLTKRVDSLSAFVATAITVVSVCVWMFARSPLGAGWLPWLAERLPDDFMINVLSNIFIFVFAYLFAALFRKKSRPNTARLTIWTKQEHDTSIKP
jgi:SSS family solute:Na+ symporter